MEAHGQARRRTSDDGRLVPKATHPMTPDVRTIVDGVIRGDRRMLARAISRVENGTPDAADILTGVYAQTGKGYRIGVTGPPGAGKSTLTNKLAALYRTRG